MSNRFLPLFELTRGPIVESIHFGAVAVADSQGKTLYSYGDPQTVAFLRSSAKPFQALPFFERGGPEHYGLTQKEQALVCASHEGSDEHVHAAETIQAKVGISESDLQCGVHMPGDPTAYKMLIARGERPTPNRNNCSGKHSGMLAHAKMRGLPLENYLDMSHPIQQDILSAFAQMCGYARDDVEIGIQESDLQCGVHMPGDPTAYRMLIARGEKPTPNRNNCSGKHSGMLAHAKMRDLPLESYLDMSHPIQQDILSAFAQMCGYARDDVEIGIDGCSAPNFAVPLRNAALGFAVLCDPRGLSEARARGCRAVTAAMTSFPEMVSGEREFDCRLMQVGRGRIVCKRGAEGYQAIGLMPGVLGAGAPGVGIAFKVSDGDLLFRTINIEPLNRVRPAVTLEILRQLGALSDSQLNELSSFGPVLPIKNHRGTVVGESRPAFKLEKAS